MIKILSIAKEFDMSNADVDFEELLGPAKITIKDYQDRRQPLMDNQWVENSDLAILELAKFLPTQLSFLYSMIHEHPSLLPKTYGIPGKIQELVYLDIMEKLKNKTPRDPDLEKKITQLWIENGGQKPTEVKRGGKNG